ncbi:MAG: T9SS type A sorting domain-containing protein [Bacteroidales bacterium]|nr:T9SS type A sorting domain-containing protein [Bacteroidales bacterium]
MKTKVFFAFFMFALCATVFPKTWTITNSGTSFSPGSLTINLGDSIEFDLGGGHNSVEVNKTTWDANGNAPLEGGWETPFGGGLVLAEKLTEGTHYFVCDPHASFGMKGTIVVQAATDVAINGQEPGFTVFPNPAEDYILITSQNLVPGTVYYLIDDGGRHVRTGKLTTESTRVEIGKLPVGAYMLHVQLNDKQVYKVVIKKISAGHFRVGAWHR